MDRGRIAGGIINRNPPEDTEKPISDRCSGGHRWGKPRDGHPSAAQRLDPSGAEVNMRDRGQRDAGRQPLPSEACFVESLGDRYDDHRAVGKNPQETLSPGAAKYESASQIPRAAWFGT
jgi:hypothetical protein